MANICINRFYCSTDNEANYEKILYGLGDRFDLHDLDGRDNWMRGEFDSKWCYPEEAIAAMMKKAAMAPLTTQSGFGRYSGAETAASSLPASCLAASASASPRARSAGLADAVGGS